MTGTDLASQNGSSTEVGPLAFDGLSHFSARDLALPKLYKADYTTKAVKKGLVKAGSLFVATEPEDEDPVVLVEGTEHGTTEPVTIHALALRWGKSDDEKSEDNPKGELRTYAYDDPEAPATAWTTYTYCILVPQYDPDIPCTLLLTKSSRGGALKLNTAAQRIAPTPLYTKAFGVTLSDRHNAEGDWFIYRIAEQEPVEENVEAAKVLYDQVAASFARKQITPRPTDIVVDAGPAI